MFSSIWLSPIGELNEYKGLSHAYSEPFILKKEYGEVAPRNTPPYLTLENKGWVRLSDFYSGNMMFILNKGKSLNNNQINTIKKWCIEKNRDYATVIHKI